LNGKTEAVLMKRDAELAELEAKVRKIFGMGEFTKAYSRGWSRAAALNGELSKAARIDLAEMMSEHPGVQLVDGKEAADAMKFELRRMLTVH
jgi:hypothetical protein